VSTNYSDPSEPNKQRHGPGHAPGRDDSDANVCLEERVRGIMEETDNAQEVYFY